MLAMAPLIDLNLLLEQEAFNGLIVVVLSWRPQG